MVASDEILKRVSDQYRRIRNTFRFILGNLNDFDESKKILFEDQIELDKCLLIRSHKSYEFFEQHYDMSMTHITLKHPLAI